MADVVRFNLRDSGARMRHIPQIMTQEDELSRAAALDIEKQAIEAAFRNAAEQYVSTRRTRIEYFTRRHFSFAGAIRLHRAALGADLLRAPVNLALALPHILKLLVATILRRSGAARAADYLFRLPTQLETAVAREVDWLIWAEFLELPYRDGGRESDRDALGEFLLAQPKIAAAVTAAKDFVRQNRRDEDFGLRLQDLLSRYTGTRVAAAEIATALTSAGVGGLVVQQLTPTAFTLGPALAVIVAHQAAIFAFPLGTALGGLWYGLFPVEPSWGLIAGVTAGLMVLSSIGAAFAGVLADPVQKRLGIHRRRLEKLVDAIEADLVQGQETGFKVRAHYVARMFDFFEAVRLALRAAT
ncbi:MAG: DUF6635 family protein [Alphaproteobacteria bacterium]